jgi:release factor glutamine methyltransferase
LNAERLLSHVLQIPRIELYLNFERPLSVEERAGFKRLLLRRVGSEPLQYILGETEFMSLPFLVNDSVLIPRPETELLVEQAVLMFQKKNSAEDTIALLDIGTGSGCIAVSVAKQCSQVRVLALDISSAALATAQINAEINGVQDKIEFVNGDILQLLHGPAALGTFDAIVSNPPYVSSDEFKRLPEEIRLFEPADALDDGHDGLTFFRTFSRHISHLMKPGAFFLVEAGEGQADTIKKMFLENFSKITIIDDYNGIPRVLSFEQAKRVNM